MSGLVAAAESLPYRPCVGIVLANPEGLVFAAERIDIPGQWQMPQGGIDTGETPSEAAGRELEEEIGVGPELAPIEAEVPGWLTYDLPGHLIGKVWKGRYRGQRQKWFLARFRGDDEAIRLDTGHPEFAQWRWMTPEALIEAIVPFKAPIYRDVFAAFADRLGGGSGRGEVAEAGKSGRD